jgi:hypothetical protein
MSPRPFYTRSPRWSFLKLLVEEHADLSFSREDFARLFKAVDKCCSEIFPAEGRGNWFSPIFLGGTGVDHTPPHIISAVYAIYSDLVAGCPEPVPFLSGPLRMDGTTAVRVDSGGYLVESCHREASPLTDILIRVRAKLPEQWLSDIYGTPRLAETSIRVGWNMAADAQPTAISGGYLLLHERSKSVLDPIAPSFTEEDKALFFAEPVMEARLERYRERIAEQIGIPLDVLQRNHDTARRAVEAYLAL